MQVVVVEILETQVLVLHIMIVAIHGDTVLLKHKVVRSLAVVLVRYLNAVVMTVMISVVGQEILVGMQVLVVLEKAVQVILLDIVDLAAVEAAAGTAEAAV